MLLDHPADQSVVGHNRRQMREGCAKLKQQVQLIEKRKYEKSKLRRSRFSHIRPVGREREAERRGPVAAFALEGCDLREQPG
jgi:hypothetical protein